MTNRQPKMPIDPVEAGLERRIETYEQMEDGVIDGHAFTRRDASLGEDVIEDVVTTASGALPHPSQITRREKLGLSYKGRLSRSGIIHRRSLLEVLQNERELRNG